MKMTKKWMRVWRWLFCDLWNGQRPSDQTIGEVFAALALSNVAAALLLFAPAFVCLWHAGWEGLSVFGAVVGVGVFFFSSLIVGVMVYYLCRPHGVEKSVVRKRMLVDIIILMVMFCILYTLCLVRFERFRCKGEENRIENVYGRR